MKNELTRKLNIKGYNLKKPTMDALGICLSTYRKYEKPGHPQHENLKGWIDKLESKR